MAACCAAALTACNGSASGGGGTGRDGGAGASGGSSGGAAGATGAAGQGGSTTSTGGAGGAATGTACTVGAWPAADPSMAGPFTTVTETNVGPAAGMGADGGPPVAFTLFRPSDLTQGGLCHPVITWGNGTGTGPSTYRVLLNHLASHGFVVIASDSPNVAQGNPPPMVAGVTWVLEQNADPTSVMYQRIDTTHVGATGHSQGAFATTMAGADAHITTIAPICGASTQRNLHGPALLICGGMDTTVPCSTVMTAFNGITNQPIMLADDLAATHVNWVTFRAGGALSIVEVAVTAWMRVQLMGDTALRPRFYGASCALCTDAAWQVMQKMMDQ
jgi:predicted dienelactone hydrolase